MIKKPIAIAFSDIHFNKWKQFNDEGKRIYDSVRAMKEISDECIHLGSKDKPLPLLFAGDLLHNPKKLDNDIFNQVSAALRSVLYNRGITMYSISGNHDQFERNTITHNSATWLNGLAELTPKYFKLVDFSYQDVGPIRIHGIPYLKNNNGFMESLEQLDQYTRGSNFNILMIHTDIPGAEDCSNRVIEKVDGLPAKLKRAFKKYRLVLNGHIHKPQVNIKGKLITLGSPIHQVKSDAGEKMGYWVIYNDASYMFNRLKGYPRFINLKAGKEPKEDRNFYITKPKLRVESEDAVDFTNTEDRIGIGNKYCKVNKATKEQQKALVTILNQTYEITNF